MIELFKEKKSCCGCAACANACPRQVITMQPDEDGFIYPVVNGDLCVECGLCQKVCAFQNIPVTADEPLATYAATNKNQEILLNSASGGLFGALASLVFEKNGVVFGCAWNFNMEPEHICIDNLADTKKLQGSKYVQSSIKNTYTEALKYLKSGKHVLFTGTPCQIAGLKSYLGKDYENLITSDLICHGVPNSEFFKGYINYLEGKLKGKVIDFKFRDKSKGWSLLAKATYIREDKTYSKMIPISSSYYYTYFLYGDIYRENCYECKYAGGNRQGDFTMGDYWGVQQAHPEIKTKNGVSVLLANSEKGVALIEKMKKYLDLTPSTFEQARSSNGQLGQPTSMSSKRDEILRLWREEGSQAVADKYKITPKEMIANMIRALLPYSVKETMKKVFIK